PAPTPWAWDVASAPTDWTDRSASRLNTARRCTATPAATAQASVRAVPLVNPAREPRTVSRGSALRPTSASNSLRSRTLLHVDHLARHAAVEGDDLAGHELGLARHQ